MWLKYYIEESIIPQYRGIQPKRHQYLDQINPPLNLTWVSFSCRAFAISIRLALVRYLLKWNSFSSSVSCLLVKFVRPVLLVLLSRRLFGEDEPGWWPMTLSPDIPRQPNGSATAAAAIRLLYSCMLVGSLPVWMKRWRMLIKSLILVAMMECITFLAHLWLLLLSRLVWVSEANLQLNRRWFSSVVVVGRLLIINHRKYFFPVLHGQMIIKLIEMNFFASLLI